MKIYTEVNLETGRKVLDKLEKVSTVERGRTGSGCRPSHLTLMSGANGGAIGYNHDDTGGVSNSPGPYYESKGHTRKSNAEFVRLIAKELPKTKPVPLAKMTKAQLLKVIEKNAKGCSDTTRALVSEKQTLESLLSESGQKLSEAETHNDELQTEIDSLKEHLEGAKQGLANAKDEGGQFREGCIRKDLEKAAVQDELSSLKKNIMLLSGIAMGVKV